MVGNTTTYIDVCFEHQLGIVGVFVPLSRTGIVDIWLAGEGMCSLDNIFIRSDNVL